MGYIDCFHWSGNYSFTVGIHEAYTHTNIISPWIKDVRQPQYCHMYRQFWDKLKKSAPLLISLKKKKKKKHNP